MKNGAVVAFTLVKGAMDVMMRILVHFFCETEMTVSRGKKNFLHGCRLTMAKTRRAPVFSSRMARLTTMLTNRCGPGHEADLQNRSIVNCGGLQGLRGGHEDEDALVPHIFSNILSDDPECLDCILRRLPLRIFGK